MWLGVNISNQARSEGIKGVQGNEDGEPNTNSYESLESTEDDVIRIPHLKRKANTRLEKTHKKSALVLLPTWHKKFQIGEKVEMCCSVNIDSNAHISGNLVLCWGSLEDVLHLPLHPLVIFVINFSHRATIQFTAPSYVALDIFDCINNLKDLNNGELDMDYFLYY